MTTSASVEASGFSWTLANPRQSSHAREIDHHFERAVAPIAIGLECALEIRERIAVRDQARHVDAILTNRAPGQLHERAEIRWRAQFDGQALPERRVPRHVVQAIRRHAEIQELAAVGAEIDAEVQRLLL